jgi:outer membrane lipoprotein SlyB
VPVAWIKIAGAALLGALAGALLGGVRTCSSQACRSRANRIYTIVAGAVFGAGVGAWLVYGDCVRFR